MSQYKTQPLLSALGKNKGLRNAQPSFFPSAGFRCSATASTSPAAVTSPCLWPWRKRWRRLPLPGSRRDPDLGNSSVPERVPARWSRPPGPARSGWRIPAYSSVARSDPTRQCRLPRLGPGYPRTRHPGRFLEPRRQPRRRFPPVRQSPQRSDLLRRHRSPSIPTGRRNPLFPGLGLSSKTDSQENACYLSFCMPKCEPGPFSARRNFSVRFRPG